jgi:hypothetical protein
VRDELDLAIRYGALADSRLVVRRLITTEPVVVAAPSYLARHGAPKSPLDLTRHNCLAYDRAGRPHRTWRFLRGKKSTEVRVNGDRSVDDASLARTWALAGAGIAASSDRYYDGGYYDGGYQGVPVYYGAADTYYQTAPVYYGRPAVVYAPPRVNYVGYHWPRYVQHGRQNDHRRRIRPLVCPDRRTRRLHQLHRDRRADRVPDLPPVAVRAGAAAVDSDASRMRSGDHRPASQIRNVFKTKVADEAAPTRDTVTADIRRAVVLAWVGVDVIRVVALFARVHGAIAACRAGAFFGARRGASVARRGVAVVALFPGVDGVIAAGRAGVIARRAVRTARLATVTVTAATAGRKNDGVKKR